MLFQLGMGHVQKLTTRAPFIEMPWVIHNVLGIPIGGVLGGMQTAPLSRVFMENKSGAYQFEEGGTGLVVQCRPGPKLLWSRFQYVP